jgi:acyl carrier protein
MDDVAKDVVAIISARIRGTKRDIQLSDRLDALGIESLDVLEITFDLEQRFNIEIPFNANTKLEFETVGDMVAAIRQLVAEKAGSK